jgi:hypothetical protein
VVHESTGLLVEPGAELPLADALARLISSADLRKSFGEAGRARLEAEFAVEQTVRPLYAKFQEVVKPSSAPAYTPAGTACLLHEWPAADRTAAELHQLQQAQPQLRVYTITAAPAAPTAIPHHIDFLPDAMVLEGEWQQDREHARLIETWRAELGQQLSSELFLQHARYALYLRRWIARDGVRHLHAVSSRELLCAWMLHRLCGISYSVSLEEKTVTLSKTAMLRLTRESIGLRIAGGSAAAEIFKQELPQPRQMLVHHKHGRALEPEWITHLLQWGTRPTA